MITQEQLRSRIQKQEEDKNKFASDAQIDMNRRMAIIQQAENERIKKGNEYQTEINRREGAIDELKKLLDGDTVGGDTVEPTKRLDPPGTSHSRSV